MGAKDYGLAGQCMKSLWRRNGNPGPHEIFVLRPPEARLRLGSGRPVKRFFYVYILVSEGDETIHYTGLTENLRERLRDHNRGACLHSAKYRPWRLQTAIAFGSGVKARAFERYLKSGSGREFARRHL